MRLRTQLLLCAGVLTASVIACTGTHSLVHREVVNHYEQALSFNRHALQIREVRRIAKELTDVLDDTPRSPAEEARIRASLEEARVIAPQLAASLPGNGLDEERSFDEAIIALEQVSRNPDPLAAFTSATTLMNDHVRPTSDAIIAADVHAADRSTRDGARVDDLAEWMTLLGAFVIAVFAGPALLVLAVRARTRLAKLEQAAEVLSQGDFTVRIPVCGNDEIANALRAFNKMAEELQASTITRDVLEQLIRERTSDLVASSNELSAKLEELRTARAQLYESERLASVGLLAAGVAHEINNPLAFVISNIAFIEQNLETALEDPDELDEVRSALEDVSTGAQRVRDIVRDLKTLSRSDDSAGGSIDAVSVCEMSIKLSSGTHGRTATVVSDLASVPLVPGNPGKLGQVVLNLIVNAAQAMPPRPATENLIHVSTSTAEGAVRITVEDNGAGMPAEVRRRIFEPFFTTKPVGVGTGLGLSVSRSIVEALGGSIDVDSEPGRGSRFTVTLPLAAADHAGEPLSAAA